jgi:Asp-tRNA(Asn)/Glu-tRNA(Gln) amidotransferase C subunit
VIGKEDLPQLALLAGLEIAEEHSQAVLANLQRIEQVAQQLNAVELQPGDELAAWKP